MKKIFLLCALLLVPCAAQATSFVYGGSGPIGTFPDAGPLVFPKVTNAAQPGIPANKQLYSDDINAIWQDLLDLRTGVVFGDYFGFTNQVSAPAAPASGMRVFDLNGMLSTESAAGVVTSVGDALFFDGGGGLVFTAGAIVQVPSLDAGIVLSRTYGASALTGTNAYSVITNGARIDFGAGANDYASSNGTTVTFAGPVATPNLRTTLAGSVAPSRFVADFPTMTYPMVMGAIIAPSAGSVVSAELVYFPGTSGADQTVVWQVYDLTTTTVLCTLTDTKGCTTGTFSATKRAAMTCSNTFAVSDEIQIRIASTTSGCNPGYSNINALLQ